MCVGGGGVRTERWGFSRSTLHVQHISACVTRWMHTLCLRDRLKSGVTPGKLQDTRCSPDCVQKLVGLCRGTAARETLSFPQGRKATLVLTTGLKLMFDMISNN